MKNSSETKNDLHLLKCFLRIMLYASCPVIAAVIAMCYEKYGYSWILVLLIAWITICILVGVGIVVRIKCMKYTEEKEVDE